MKLEKSKFEQIRPSLVEAVLLWSISILELALVGSSKITASSQNELCHDLVTQKEKEGARLHMRFQRCFAFFKYYLDCDNLWNKMEIAEQKKTHAQCDVAFEGCWIFEQNFFRIKQPK